MEQWSDQGIILSVRPHGEKGAVVSVLTKEHGRHAGYVYGAASRQKQGMLQPGNTVSVDWSARVSDNLGTWSMEQTGSGAVAVMDDPLRLGALLSACALMDKALPERECHGSLYHGTEALIASLPGPVWDASYIFWELAFLKELGFGLDLLGCAGGGDDSDLVYVSPRTGRAVSGEKGEPYKDKLLHLPPFLVKKHPPNSEEMLQALVLTAYFLEHRAFVHNYDGLPEPRLRFQQRVERLYKTPDKAA